MTCVTLEQAFNVIVENFEMIRRDYPKTRYITIDDNGMVFVWYNVDPPAYLAADRWWNYLRDHGEDRNDETPLTIHTDTFNNAEAIWHIDSVRNEFNRRYPHADVPVTRQIVDFMRNNVRLKVREGYAHLEINPGDHWETISLIPVKE